MENLQGKIALLTGGTRGIGKAIAIELIKEGATVILNYSKDDLSAEETLKEIEALGGYAKLYKGDISNFEVCKAMVDFVISTFGKIDILINNAAVSFRGLFMDFSDRNINDIFGINVLGTMYLSKEVIPYMLNKGK
ncbi:MAG: SDR family NAD(P)-dependent oxidoreductase, partial [Clostridium sartagoforme]|nr:SDR family NAD(P)-dependent oxidoreductase [Clostridium sartagoforme]